MPDTLGYRKRIGLVVPSTNTTVQPETEMLRVPGVTCHTGRVTIKERPLNTEEAFYEHMQMMRDGMGTAIDQIMTAGLDHLVMGIALESFWGGVAAADKLQADLAQRAGVGISMGSTASVAALNKFGSRKIAILTPHQPRGDEMVRAYFVEAGFDVVRLKGLKCTTPRLIAQVSSQDIRNALMRAERRRHRCAVDARHRAAGGARSPRRPSAGWASRCWRSTWCPTGMRSANAASRTASSATGGSWRSSSTRALVVAQTASAWRLRTLSMSDARSR